MKTTTDRAKAFDCVEFKRRSQERLIKEYEARKDDFCSYVEFLKTKVDENAWSRAFWRGLK